MKKTFLALAMALAFSGEAMAAVSVGPIHVGVPFGAKATQINLENHNEGEVVLDVRVKKWTTDENGQDVLSDTDAILMSRPVVTIPAGQSAVVRMFIKNRENANEDTYRVFVTDITPASGTGVSSKLNFSLPMFVLNSKTNAGQVEVKDGKIENIGTRHVRLTEYTTKDGKTEKTLRYVMQGKSIALPVAAGSKVEVNDEIY